MISICIPTYEQQGHGAFMLSQLLESIRSQTFTDYEIVISDNSCDRGIFREVMRWDLPIRYVINNNRGVAVNTNNAIRHADSDNIKIMYQDDLFLHDDALFLFSEKMEGWVASYSHHINGEGTIFNDVYPSFNGQYLNRFNKIGMPSVTGFRHQKGLWFDERLKTMLDVEFYHKLYNLYGQPRVIRKFVVGQRIWDGCISNNQDDYADEELKMIQHEKSIGHR
jgi:glycosyltransferase involved in cell wall biosynthesis